MRDNTNRKEGGKDDGPRLVSCARGGGSTYYFADHVLLTIMGQKLGDPGARSLSGARRRLCSRRARAWRSTGEATGYSDSFDFAEAFRDANGKLPDQASGIPDWLYTYEVMSIGAEIGAIAGFIHKYVKVRG